MRNYLKTLLIAMIAAAGVPAGAQVSPVAEAQLDKGFLGDQNSRLSDQGQPPADSYAGRAVAALDRKDYTRALGILRPHRRSHDVAYHYLAGRAYEGLGDYPAARRELAEAVRRGRTAIAPQLAFGLIEAQHGERAIAEEIMANFVKRSDKCAGRCDDALQLLSAIMALEDALRATPK
jgi:tetratricopeptide (TPR) repeat protein